MINIHSFVREVEDDYKNHELEIVDGLNWNMYKELNTIEYLVTGHFEQGDEDPDSGLKKPFFDQISRVRLNQMSAEDVDPKDLYLKPDEPKWSTHAWLLNKINRVWIREQEISEVADDMTQTRGDYGGLLVQVTESKNDLFIDVVDWHTGSFDPTNIETGVKVLREYLDPAELMERKNIGWGQGEFEGSIDDAIDVAVNNKDGDNPEDKKTPGKYVEVRKLFGTLPVAYLKAAKGEDYDEEDEKKYKTMMIITANSERKEVNDRKEIIDEKGAILFAEEMNDPTFFYLPYEKMKRRSLGRGTIEKAKHSQWWSNWAVKLEQDAMDYAGKVFLQAPTGNKALKKNVRTDLKNGHVFEYTPGHPITPLNMAPAGLGHFQNLVQKWSDQLDRSSFTHAANTGENMPADTPYRETAILNIEANKPYAVRREQMGDFWRRIYRERIVPFLVKRAKQKDVIEAELTVDEMRELDEQLSAWFANEEWIDRLTSGYYDRYPATTRWLIAEQDYEEMKENTKEKFKKQGDRRWFTDFPKGYWEEVEKHVTPEVSNTEGIKAVYIESISRMIRDIIATYNPQTNTFLMLEHPVTRQLFNEIAEAAGYSPIKLEQAMQEAARQQQSQQAQQPQQPMLPPQLQQQPPQGPKSETPPPLIQ